MIDFPGYSFGSGELDAPNLEFGRGWRNSFTPPIGFFGVGRNNQGAMGGGASSELNVIDTLPYVPPSYAEPIIHSVDAEGAIVAEVGGETYFIKPGESFVKTWRVQNTGTCTWTSNYKLLYAYGNIAGAQMSGQPLSIPGNVAPGQTVDLSVTLIAPLTPLIYQGFWQIENASGKRFGQTIWVGITTTQMEKATPVATGTSTGVTCTVTLTGPTTIIPVGTDFDAVWTVKNTSGEDWSSNSVDYKFISGTEMHKKAVYDLAQTIKNGESGQIIVDMIAPATPGPYSAEWAIVAGSTTLCFLSVAVSVK